MPSCSGRLASAFMLLLLPLSAALAQTGYGPGAGSNEWAETSRTPFRIKLSGFINTQPEELTLTPGEQSLGVALFKVGTAKEAYQFELVKAEAIDNPHVSAGMILQQLHKYAIDFDLTGPRDLLSKVGQAEPGTPLTLIGFFYQHNRSLILEQVETIGTREQ